MLIGGTNSLAVDDATSLGAANNFSRRLGLPSSKLLLRLQIPCATLQVATFGLLITAAECDDGCVDVGQSALNTAVTISKTLAPAIPVAEKVTSMFS